MTMGPGLRKFALTIHLTSSVGWIGAAIAYLALGVAAAISQDAQTVRAAWIAMEVIISYVIVPLALTALWTGILMSLGTPWGLFRHYWVVITLVMTVLATAVLLLHLPAVTALAEVAREADAGDLGPVDDLGHVLVHAGGGLLVLLLIAALNVYKPRGLTRYGWRKQQARAQAAQVK